MLVVPLCGSSLPILAQCSSTRTVVVPAATTRRRSSSARFTSRAVSAGREYLSEWSRISDTSVTRTG